MSFLDLNLRIVKRRVELDFISVICLVLMPKNLGILDKFMEFVSSQFYCNYNGCT